jgi:hypothetical protein
MRKFVLSLAIALTALPGLAQAAEPPCLTSREFGDLSSYAMPSIITGTAERCSAALPAGSFLRRDGAALAARYAAIKPAAWPGAKAAFIKLSSGMSSEAVGLFRTLPDDKLQPMVDTLVEGLIAQQIPPERCSAIDLAIEALAPLPPQNTAKLIALALGLGSTAGGAKLCKISLCPA